MCCLSAVNFIRGLGVQSALRDKALVVFVEALEDRNADVRCAAAIAIKLMKVRNNVERVLTPGCCTRHWSLSSESGDRLLYGAE